MAPTPPVIARKGVSLRCPLHSRAYGKPFTAHNTDPLFEGQVGRGCQAGLQMIATILSGIHCPALEETDYARLTRGDAVLGEVFPRGHTFARTLSTTGRRRASNSSSFGFRLKHCSHDGAAYWSSSRADAESISLKASRV